MDRIIFSTWLVAASLARAATFQEDFAHDPLAHGWQVFGNTNLFHWDPANQNLAVTWDSSQTNSYFQLPLGTIVARDDDFSLALDLRLDIVLGGVNTNKPSTFELAFGLQNIVDAEGSNFFRGNGTDSPNLVEFDFFPQTEFRPTIWPAVWSTNSMLNYNGSSDYTLLDLPVGIWLHITMDYAPSNATLVTTLTTNGVSIGAIHPVPLNSSFTDFRVTAFAIESYSDAAQSGVAGSLLAQGAVDNVVVTTPPPPIQDLRGGFSNGRWQVQFLSRSNWLYTLEQTEDFQTWIAVSAGSWGNGTNLVLQDNGPPPAQSFYRVRAERP